MRALEELSNGITHFLHSHNKTTLLITSDNDIEALKNVEHCLNLQKKFYTIVNVMNHQEVDLLLTHVSTLLVIFGFTNIGPLTNLYLAYRLEQFKNKIIFICNKLILHPTLDASLYFAPIHNNRLLKHLFIHLKSATMSHTLHQSTQQIFEGAAGKPQFNRTCKITDIIEKKIMTKDVLMMQMLADRIRQDNDFKALLFQIILSSRDNQEMLIAAANAITALKYAKIPFTGIDFSHIQVPYADLSGALFDYTKLVKANLKGATLRHAWLRKSNLTGADLSEVEFGEPWNHQLNGEITCMHYDQDHTLFVGYKRVGSKDKIGIYNVYSGECLKVINDCDNRYLISTLDQKTLIICSSRWGEYTLQFTALTLWDISSGQCLKTLIGHEDTINCLALAADQRTLISGSSDKTLRIWDIDSGQCLKILIGHENSVNCLTLSADQKTLISGSYKTIYIWDITSAQHLQTLTLSDEDSILCLALAADQKTLVSGGNKMIYVWDITIGQCLKMLTGHEESINCLILAANQSMLISGSQDRTLRIWDITTGNCSKVLIAHEGNINCLALTADQKTLISGSSDNTLRAWDISHIKTGDDLPTAEDHYGNIRCLTLSSRHSLLITGSKDRTLRIWDSNSGHCVKKLSGHEQGITCLVLAADENTLISGSEDKTLRLWDVMQGRCLNIFIGHASSITCLMLSNDQAIVISGDEYGELRVWNIVYGQCLNILNGHDHHITCITLSTDQKTLISGSIDQTIRIWDVASGQCLNILNGHESVITCLTLLHDQKTLFTSSNDKTIRVWDTASGRCLKIFHGHDSLVNCFKLTADQKMLISGSYKTIKIWDASSGQCLKTLSGHESFISCLILSSDQKTLISASEDKTVRVWDMNHFILKSAIKVPNTFVSHLCLEDNDLSLITANGPSLKCWKFNKDHQDWQLYWSTNQSDSMLLIEDCSASDIKLDEKYNYLFKQENKTNSKSNTLHDEQNTITTMEDLANPLEADSTRFRLARLRARRRKTLFDQAEMNQNQMHAIAEVEPLNKSSLTVDTAFRHKIDAISLATAIAKLSPIFNSSPANQSDLVIANQAVSFDFSNWLKQQQLQGLFNVSTEANKVSIYFLSINNQIDVENVLSEFNDYLMKAFGLQTIEIIDSHIDNNNLVIILGTELNAKKLQSMLSEIINAAQSNETRLSANI